MNIKMKCLALGSLTAFAFLGMLGISTTARADGHEPFNAICQSDAKDAGNTRYYPNNDCGEDANPNVLVPAKPHKCFFLTDITVFGNNPVAGGGHEVDLLDGTSSRANPAKVVFVAPWISTAPTVVSQDWRTPIVFTGNLYADVISANNNIYITVSGFYDECPKS